jgi:hypothetical protein
MIMPDHIQPKQPRREFKNYSRNFLNIRLTAWAWPRSNFHWIGLLKNHVGGRCFTDDEKVETEVQKWLRQRSEDFCAEFRHTGKAIGQVYWCW